MRASLRFIIFASLLTTSAFSSTKQKRPSGVIIGTVDHRVPSNDPAVGRIMNVGCTGWLLSNGAVLTAGHCISTSSMNLQFNVPLSLADGTPQPPTASNIYPLTLYQYENTTADWAVLSAGTNPGGVLPQQAQNAFFRPTDLAIPVNQTLLRVTGYGVDGPPPNYGNPPPCNKYSQTQQTAVGAYQGSATDPVTGFITINYLVDTQPGNSGSPVILNGSRTTLGIHIQGSKQPTGNFNSAASFQYPKLRNALHAFPGSRITPNIPGGNIFYVDNGSSNSGTNGNIFTPFNNLTDAVNAVSSLIAPSLIVITAGQYAEGVSTNQDITVNLKSDVTWVMPVGDATFWSLERVKI